MSQRIFLALALALASTVPAWAGSGSGSSSPAAPIVDLTEDTITLGSSFTIQAVNVGLDITHSWRGDMEITLEHAGTVVTLLDNQGGSADDVLVTFGSTGTFDSGLVVSDLSTVIDAQGPGSMVDYLGADAVGDWNLSIDDTFPGSDDGVLNFWSVDASSTPPGVAAGCSTPATPIIDLVADTITLTDSIIVADAQASIDITHTFQGDMVLSLISPGAAVAVTLSNTAGGSGDDILVTFASTGVPFDSGLLASGLGTLMQAQGPGAMSDLHGLDSAGGWTLDIEDTFPGSDDGVLNEWCITLDENAPPPPAPANDDCSGAETLAFDTPIAFDTTLATASGIAPTCGSGPNVDIWYVFSAPCTGDVTISLCGSLYDTRLTVHDGTAGCPVDGSAQVACNDDACSTQSELTFAATAGTTYYVAVGGWNGNTGEGTILMTNGAIPDNDTCGGAESITDGTTAWDNTCATQSGQVPGCGGGTDPFDLWYAYTATCDGDLTVDTFGSGFDTRLAVWAACGDASPIACNDDTGGLQSEVVLTGVTSGTVFLIQVAGFSGGVGSDGLLNIQCGLPAVLPVTDLLCEAGPAGSGMATVSWLNGEAYDSIEIYVDGLLASTVAGGDTTAPLTGLAPFSTVEICVRPILAGTEPVDTCCTLAIPGDTTGLTIIVDGDGGSLDNAAAVSAALTANGVTHTILGSVAEITGTPARAFVLLGTYPNNTSLTSTDGQILADIQAAGCPVAISGGDTWGFDAATPFNDGDGVDAVASDGNDTFMGMLGANVFAGFDAAYTQESTGNDYTDQIAPATPGTDIYGDDAQIAWSDDGSGGSASPYDTGTTYLTPTEIGNVIATSWEFAGYGGDQNALMAAMLDFLALTPEPTFIRGDSNDDGMFDVADAQYTLSYLFSGGAAHNCDDAADSNDDGALNLGDPVFTVTALFSGGPQPPAPVGTCGVDPTDDALGCEDYMSCGLVKKSK